MPRLLTSDPLVLFDRLTSDLLSKSIGNQQLLDHLKRVVCNGLSWDLWQWGDIKQFGKDGGVDEVSWICSLRKNEVALQNGSDGGYMPRHVTGHVPTSLHFQNHPNQIYFFKALTIYSLMLVRTLPVTTACSYEQNSAFVTGYQLPGPCSPLALLKNS